MIYFADDFVCRSNVSFSENMGELRALEISHVVNVTQDVDNYFESSGLKYLRVPVLNLKGENLEVPLCPFNTLYILRSY